MSFSRRYTELPLQPFFTPPFHEIIPHLYIGSQEALKRASLFDYIINCTRHIPNISTIPTIRIPVNDDPQESVALIDAIHKTDVLKIIHKARQEKKRVLVHCHAGMQRSCTIVAIYLMYYYNLSAEEVLRYIPTKRPIAFQPQATFKKVIHEFHTSLGKVTNHDKSKK
jgi:dual specificity MAP kinase phosphatase